MQIKVTQQHIKKGRRASARSCPIALALNEQVGALAIVGHGSASAGVDPNRRHFDLPRAVRRFIYQFDEGKAVKPFNFRVLAQ